MRILLVDDEWLIRDMVAEALRGEGYEVLEAASGDEALGICAQGGFDILVTDIRMPGKTNGWDLAERCRASSPDLPVVYVTAYSDVKPREVSGSQIVRKPFRHDALIRAVHIATGRPPLA